MTKFQKQRIKAMKEEIDILKLIIKNVAPLQCPYCKSTRLIKHGIRKNLETNIQRYCCLNCQKRFSNINYLTFRKRIAPDKIEKIIKLHQKNYSSRDIAKRIRNISHTAVCDIIAQYKTEMN